MDALIRSEWFWAIITVVLTTGIFFIQTIKETRISRANFVYNISNDFGNNDRILTVYQFLENCRRHYANVTNYRKLDFDKEKAIVPITFIDIDTYVNHFEVVYVILHSVTIKNIDDLFQQRFLSFMLNPYIQREELFSCFVPDENDFLLLKKWLHSICSRNRFTSEKFIAYLNDLTCGKFEFSKEHLAVTKERWPWLYERKAKRYLLNYVYNICNPRCQYGYYNFKRTVVVAEATEDKKEKTITEEKTMRILRSCADDDELEDIMELQDRVIRAMPRPELYFPSSREEIAAALRNPKDYACLQICHGPHIVAFATLIINPSAQQNPVVGLNSPFDEKGCCVLDTVFVHPEYRGFGMQRTLINILCSWAATLGKQQICATVHPDNSFSAKNFEDNGFRKVTDTPVPKYGGLRNIYAKPLTRKDKKENADGIYTVFPYV